MAVLIEKEEWKNLQFVYKNFSNYEISNFGNIRSKYSNKWKTIKQSKNKFNNYLFVNLTSDCKYSNNQVEYMHRLVAFLFCYKPPNKYTEVNHLDGNKENNYYRNLRWHTRLENMQHAVRIGLIKLKLTREQIIKIKQLYKNTILNHSYQTLANKFDVSRMTIRNIIKGKGIYAN